MTMKKNNIFQLLLTICIIILSGCTNAQQTTQATENTTVTESIMFIEFDTNYAFINYDTNHLFIGRDTSAFRKLAAKWDAAISGNGNLSIMQIGASHVQGGTFPHRVRRNILTQFSEAVADRGMIFPYSAAVKCNNPYDYKVSRSHDLTLTRNVYKEPAERLGLCGIAVTAENDTVEIGIKLNEPEINFATNRIILLGEARGGIVPLIKLTDIDNNEVIRQPIEVDTILRRYTYDLGQAVDSFRIYLPCSEGQSFAITGVYLANGAPGISFHSIGVNGAALGDYINKCPYFKQDLELLKPDLVIFGIGINDASGNNFDTIAFRKRYKQLIDSIRSVNPDCAFIFVTNNDSFRRVKRSHVCNENAPLAREAFFRIAEDCGGAVWDQFVVMGGLGSMKTWQNNNLAQRDHIHFTRKGYEILGDLLSNAIFEMLLNLSRQ